MDIRTYKKNGVAFSYPSNWILDEYEMNRERGTIQITNPDGAFWMLNIYADADTTQLDARCRESVTAMQEEYDGIEISPVTRTICERTLTGYEMHFFYLDVVCIAEAIAFCEQGATYCLFWLSGDVLNINAKQKSVSTEEIFSAITASFFTQSKRFYNEQIHANSIKHF